MILIESDINRLLASFCVLDWEKVFMIDQLIFAVGCPVNQLLPLLENQQEIGLNNGGLSDAYIFTLKPFTQHNQPYFNAITELIERNKQKNDINSATAEKFLKLWINNSVKNIARLKNCSTVNEYLKVFSENQNANCTKDCIVLAAGPSLSKILPYLEELKKHFIIICVETALQAILKANIQPDFIIITDPQYYAYKHLAGLEAPESILIAPLSVHPAVFRFNAKEIILCSDKIPVSEYFENSAIGQFGDLGAGGSVASCAWTFAKMLGAKNIYLAGLDLSFPSKETHIKGSSAEKNWQIFSNKINSVEKSNSSSIFSANPQYSVDYDGNKVLTDSRMKMFAWWFESQIDKNPQINTYTLCTQSMKIPGIKTAETAELIKTVAQKPPIFIKSTENLIIQNRTKLSEQTEAFSASINSIKFLINTAIEKSIIDSDNLNNELKQIEQNLEQNPLYQLVRMAYKKMDNPLQTYTRIKKVLGF